MDTKLLYAVKEGFALVAAAICCQGDNQWGELFNRAIKFKDGLQDASYKAYQERTGGNGSGVTGQENIPF